MTETTTYDRAARQLKLLSQALDAGRLGPARRLVNTLSPAELGNLLESLPPGRRLMVWGLVPPEDDGEVLVHVGDEVRESLIQDMEPAELVAAAESLDVDDLAELMEDLPDHLVEVVLKSMEQENRERLEQVLSFPEDSAGRLTNPDVVTVRADVTVDVVLRYLRMRNELPDATDRIYVVSRRHQYLGQVSLAALLTADPEAGINDLLDETQPPIGADTPSAEVARLFEDENWFSAPVVDENNVLLGRITADDVMDIIREQAEHQVLTAAGLDEDEDLFSPVRRAARRRALWLGVNLLTAFLASWVIGRFEHVLQQVVACAVLMPVVASMGGIAGTQVLTLMVRALALGQVGFSNAFPLLRKEILVALLNGALWALVVGGIAYFVYRDPNLSLAFGSAIVLNLFAAAFAGVFIPLLLRRISIDPALAGGVILTTITDCFGFATFLGISTWLLVRV